MECMRKGTDQRLFILLIPFVTGLLLKPALFHTHLKANFVPSPNEGLPQSETLRLVDVQGVSFHGNILLQGLLVPLEVSQPLNALIQLSLGRRKWFPFRCDLVVCKCWLISSKDGKIPEYIESY